MPSGKIISSVGIVVVGLVMGLALLVFIASAPLNPLSILMMIVSLVSMLAVLSMYVSSLVENFRPGNKSKNLIDNAEEKEFSLVKTYRYKQVNDDSVIDRKETRIYHSKSGQTLGNSFFTYRMQDGRNLNDKV
jgi:hypothetical protein